MRRTLLLGILVVVLAVAVWSLTNWFEGNAHNGLLGFGGGLVLGLIRDGTPLARYGAFLIGLVFGLIAIVAGVLGPVGFLVAILILTLISALTGGRLPLWAMILGAGVFAAMFADALDTAWFILTQYPSAFFVALATSAGGFIAAVFVELIYTAEDEKKAAKAAAAAEAAETDKAQADEDQDVSADSVTGGTK
jgi:uncharacterized membrane protein